MRNVELHVTDPIVLDIRRLRGRMISNRKGTPPVFDDKGSYTLEIRSAEIAMTEASLSSLFNTYVFAYPGAPLRDLSVHFEGERVVQTGKLAKAAGIPFEIRGELSLDPDGKIRLHPISIKAAGVGVRGLLEFLGADLAKILKLHEARGVSVAGDDLILDPERLLPPPAIRGRVSHVRIENGSIVQFFGDAAPGEEGLSSQNFLRFRGGRIRFGKLTMDDSDMTIFDEDPSDPFVFYLDHYNEQLVAGYSKNTPEHGLRVFMPDYNDLQARRAEGGTPAPPRGTPVASRP
jgi:hypothetical protein